MMDSLVKQVRAVGGNVYRRHLRRDVPILCLHRIRDVNGAGPAKLAELLDHCADRYQTITLGEFATILHAGRALPRNAVVITFDDGTIDHFTLAAPALAARGLSATFALIGCTLFERALPPLHAYMHLIETAAGRSFRFGFPPVLAERDWILDADGKRVLLADDCPLRRIVQAGDPALAADVVTALGETLGIPLPDASDLFVTLDQARALVDAGHEPAGHSLRHQDVDEPDRKTWLRDLHADFDVMNDAFGRRPHPYIYPFGRTRSPDVHARIRDAGFCCAATTQWGANRRGDDPFALRRIGIDNRTPIPWPPIYR
ncbi:MAG: polysaccharide deacetylase family protein [Phycisphaerales bacterium]|nr:polysaccharide deacetylase family protein [Phycisphaerales bacterium]